MSRHTTGSTTSFVSKILETAGTLEKETLMAKLGSFAQKTEELKAEVYNALQRNHEDFHPNLMTAVYISSRVDKLSEEMESVSSKVEKEIKVQLNKSSAEFKDLSSRLQEYNAIMSILHRLVKIDEALQSGHKALKAKNFQQAVKDLATIKSMLSESASPRDKEIQILQVLQEKYNVLEKTLESEMANEWSNILKWSIHKAEDNKQDDNKGVVSAILTINAGKQSEDLLLNLLQTMQDFKMLEAKLQTLGEKFLEYVVEVILSSHGVKMKIEEHDTALCLTTKGRRPHSAPEELTATQVMELLTRAFTFLHQCLLKYELKESSNDPASGSFCLMDKFGAPVRQRFVTAHMISRCLKQSIPTSSKELEAYKQVIGATEAFQDLLITMGFLESDDSQLSDFVNDVNVLFTNKKCQDLLEKACLLMKSEIHNMIQITPDTDTEDRPITLEGASAKKVKLADNTMLNSEVHLSSDTFKLPVCHISEFAKKLMDLAYETLHECTLGEESASCCIQLFYCVRNIFILYCTIVPTYHKESLDSLPQVSALHHNNCMYLAHCLLTLGHQFQAKMPEGLNQGAATFIDLVPKLRCLGTDAFLKQMTKQRQLLVDCLSGAQGFAGVGEDKNFKQAERSIEQCLHQIQRLCNVWDGVLPDNTYHKSIGGLVNVAITQIIDQVISLEDISAKDATQLHWLLSCITAKVPVFFKTANLREAPDSSVHFQLHKMIRKWSKYNELLRVLNFSLHEISERWADGKGPLAAEFASEEVKQLIRAIFQNTEKRSAVLAKIK